MKYGGKWGCVTEMFPRFKPLEVPEAGKTTTPGGKQQQHSPEKLFTQLHLTSSLPEPLRTLREARGQKAYGCSRPFPKPTQARPAVEQYPHCWNTSAGRQPMCLGTLLTFLERLVESNCF